jgi:fumarylacetoacetase
LLELNEGAKKSISLSSGKKRTWLEDGDEVVLSGWAKGKGGKRVGFGEARGVIVPVA